MEFTIRLAKKNIGIKSIYDDVYHLCTAYLTEDVPEIRVESTPADIEYEQEKNIKEAEIEGIAPVQYTDSYLETLAVYRKIVTRLLVYDIFLMHGAVVAVGERAWLFTAPSGTGKTTHINLWLKNIPGSYIVNGDKPLLHVGEEITVFGTPWAGKEGIHRNTAVKLCGIVLLERGSENHIEKTGFSELLPILVQQSYRPSDKAELEKTLELIRKTGTLTPLYRLHCNMLPEAALTAYKALTS